jgi:FkbM family methyltransferase
MSVLIAIAQRLQFAERAVPARWRLGVRYHLQRLVGGLEPEMALLPDLVRDDGVAIDVGANYGVYAYALANRAPVVHCFEPLRECCDYIRAAGSEKIAVHNCALSDSSGTLRLHVPLVDGVPRSTRASIERPEGPFQRRDVPVRTLDSFDLPKVGFMKIDVEGAEAAVLRGARATLERDRPNLLVEIDRKRHTLESFHAVIGALRAHAYEPHVLESGALRRSSDPWTDSVRHFNFVFTCT